MKVVLNNLNLSETDRIVAILFDELSDQFNVKILIKNLIYELIYTFFLPKISSWLLNFNHLQLTNKSAHRTCLLAMDGNQIDLHDSTIVPRMADKSTELIIYARHEWPINQTTLERWTVMFIYTRISRYGWKWSVLVLCFKNFVYTLTLYFRYERNYKSQPAKLEYQKSLCQTVTMKKNSMPR